MSKWYKIKIDMKEMSNNLKYVMYARKSSESEDRQVQSIDDQIKRLKNLASEKNLKIVKVYTESKSAGTPNARPLFEEMMNGIENGKYNAILTWQINRLSRNPIDSARIQWLLQCGVIKLIQTIDRAYYPDDSVLLIGVESSMANQYLLDLSKNVKRGMESKRQKGVYPHLAPIGYLNDKANHTIVKDPDKFDMVRKMWELILSGDHTRNQILLAKS